MLSRACAASERPACRACGTSSSGGGPDLSYPSTATPVRASRPPRRRHSRSVERATAEEWIRRYVEPTGEIETEKERPWATVLRVPLPGGGLCWFKACAPVQAFEPPLTAELFARCPDRVAEVLSHPERRA